MQTSTLGSEVGPQDTSEVLTLRLASGYASFLIYVCGCSVAPGLSGCAITLVQSVRYTCMWHMCNVLDLSLSTSKYCSRLAAASRISRNRLRNSANVALNASVKPGKLGRDFTASLSAVHGSAELQQGINAQLHRQAVLCNPATGPQTAQTLQATAKPN